MFEVFTEHIESTEFGNYTSYGIRVKTDSRIAYSDVSLSKDRIEAFVNKLNKFDVSPIHLYDIIQDNIGINL